MDTKVQSWQLVCGVIVEAAIFMMDSRDVHDGQQLKENPLLCYEADAALKKNHVSYVLQINTNIKFTIKYTPFSTQHVLI
jgi:hypothetical protein